MDISYYKNLKRINLQISNEQKRQIRETLIVISQLSFLKWIKDKIYLDILKGDDESIEAIKNIAEPNFINLYGLTRSQKIFKIAQISELETPISTTRRVLGDILFTEGKRTRVTHLRVERSQALRVALFKKLIPPYKCHFCNFIPKKYISLDR